MAVIRSYPFFRHLRGSETTWIRHTSNGRVKHEGTGAAFWFASRTSILSEVPVDDRELALLVHTRTGDHQDVAVQGTLTYRFADPAQAATRLDFGISHGTGQWTGQPLDQVGTLLVELAQQHAVATVARRSLAETLLDGIDAVRSQIWNGLREEPRLEGTGIAVVGVRVMGLSLQREVERALQSPERERIQGEADRAGFVRRAAAVEQERAIAENELANQIELAAREQDLVTRRGANDRQRAAEQSAAARITAEGEAERVRLKAAAQADAERARAQVRAEADRQQYETLATAGPRLLTALALRELAGSLGEIDQLTITPDVLTQLAGRLAAPTPAASS